VRETKPNPLLQRIFELRKAKKISLEQLGKALGGIKAATASQIENGDTPLKAEHIPAVAKLLGVQPWELFIDYNLKETGPLTVNEKNLILNFRKAKNESERRLLEDLAKEFAKRF
jgi:transcriptional regulator with XRE-family HTH domain